MRRPSRQLVTTALGLAALQYLLAIVLFWLLVDVAYGYEGVESFDQMGRLGAGPLFAAVAVWLPAILSPPLAVVLLFTRFRARAWVVPVAGLVVSVVGWLWAISTFEQPPRLGG